MKFKQEHVGFVLFLLGLGVFIMVCGGSVWLALSVMLVFLGLMLITAA